jgi:hypothetical protein
MIDIQIYVCVVRVPSIPPQDNSPLDENLKGYFVLGFPKFPKMDFDIQYPISTIHQ